MAAPVFGVGANLAFAGAPVGSANFSGVGGALPWGGGGGMISADSPSSAANAYSSAYRSALQQNQAMYNNIMSGYQQVLAQQQQAQQRIGEGYSSLYNDVTGKISGIGQARDQSIIDQYRAAQGKSTQSLIDRGLGNSTVLTAANRGLGLDREKALNENSERTAGLSAQYMSQLGLAGLSEGARAQTANSAMIGKQLDFMNSMTAQYPDAGLYASIARSAQNSGPRSSVSSSMPGGGQPMGAPGLGYMPRGYNNEQSGGYIPNPGAGGSGLMGASMSSGYGSSSAWNPPVADYGGYGEFGDTGGGGWMGRQADNWAGAAASYGNYGGGGDFPSPVTENIGDYGGYGEF